MKRVFKRIAKIEMLALTATLCLHISGFAQQPTAAFCAHAAGGTVYSNAKYIEEAGDVVGYELVVKPDNKALLYLYEGEPFTDPAELSVEHNRGRISASGTWHLKLKGIDGERVEQRLVNLAGSISSQSFMGSLKVGESHAEKLQLRRVPFVWGCKGKV